MRIIDFANNKKSRVGGEMYKDVDINSLLRKGFSEKFARYFVSCIEDEKQNPLYDKAYGEWALSKGFLAMSAYAYGLNDENCRQFLSDYDYYRIWPINSWSRIWIDDKMTLKYMLDGTEYSAMMPEYYFYSTPNGLRELIDNPYKGYQDIQTLINVLKEKKELACKPNNGARGDGFFKLSFRDENLYINKDIVREQDIEDFVRVNPNYIFTEYLHPETFFASVSPLIHTLRLVTVNPDGNNPRIIRGHLRFATANHGETNLTNKNADNKADFNFMTELNINDGHIGNSKSVYFNRVVSTPRHPDSDCLVDYIIPNFSELIAMIHGISNRFFNIELMGFDIGVTNNGFKLMEINTHPGIRNMQLFRSLYEDDWVHEYFKRKIKAKS